MLAFIQIQDISGNWFTVQSVDGQDQIIKRRLDDTVKLYKRRARAINAKTGALLDLRG